MSVINEYTEMSIPLIFIFQYVSEHGGQYNAYTCEEHTNYHFDVAAGKAFLYYGEAAQIKQNSARYMFLF